ncbi:MAG: SUMF1/EgtB/PvdO family nonheme iron enzyme, partial [Myxococcales bacterium]|nr:SUMF1/EgtB/PvdO family nonheme iron enzyme [Myxococcales bacterium]
TQLATGTFDDGVARLWDVASQRTLDSFHHDDAVLDVVFSPDGHRLFTASRDFTARSWGVDAHELDPGGALVALPHSRRVDAVALSPDGTRIATGSGDGRARVWDAKTGAHLATLHGHALDVLTVAFSSHGRQLATASWDGTTRVWDVDSGALAQTFADPIEPIRAVAFSPGGTQVITASQDGTARVRSTSTGELQHTLEHGSPLVDVALAPDGQRVMTLGADGTLRAWSTTTGEPLSTLVPGGPITAVVFSPDGTSMATALADRGVRTWSVESGVELVSFRGSSAKVTTVAFSADGTRLATGGDDGTARIWSASEGTLLAVFPHRGPVTSVAFSADGQRLATASGDATARLWSLETEAWRAWGCAVLEDRRGHTEATRRACSKTMAPTSRISPPPQVEPVVSTPEPARPAPELLTVHGVELVRIPGGTFTMGASPGELGQHDREGPPHEVTLSSFYLARAPVTNAQYALFLEANPAVPEPPAWERDRYAQPQQPVVGLTWDEAKAYCDWAGLVLPTEAQWEYAARAGSTTAYWFGDEAEDLERFGWFADNTGARERGPEHGRAHSVGTKGQNQWGLLDVHGNVMEWTADVHEPYTTPVRARDGSRRGSAGRAPRVVRGGSWFTTADYARSAFRATLSPEVRDRLVGLRPALIILEHPAR